MKNKSNFFLILLTGMGCQSEALLIAPPRPGLVAGVLADRSQSFEGHTLLDTATLAQIADILALSGQRASLYFDIAGNPSLLEPLWLDLPGLPAMSPNPTLFELRDSIFYLQAYRNEVAAPLIRQFLRNCQQRLDASAHQEWTDLKSSADKLAIAFSLPEYRGWRKILLEQSDGLHHLPASAPKLYCHEWPADVQVFTAGRARNQRCTGAVELGSARHFYHQLSAQLK